MGTHKLLLTLGGRPLVTYAVAAASASSADHVLVVVGHDAAKVDEVIPPGRHQFVVNADYASGLASSLAAGLRAMPAEDIGAALILADQPLMSVAAIDAILAAARSQPDQIVSAIYEGTRSHPLYFPRRFFSELLDVRGDEGGRSVLQRHATEIQLVDLGSADVSRDVDRPEDYDYLVRNWGSLAPNQAD